jgi:hypothetical protein
MNIGDIEFYLGMVLFIGFMLLVLLALLQATDKVESLLDG